MGSLGARLGLRAFLLRACSGVVVDLRLQANGAEVVFQDGLLLCFHIAEDLLLVGDRLFGLLVGAFNG